MTSTKYIGMDVHKESISIAVRNAVGKIVMECEILLHHVTCETRKLPADASLTTSAVSRSLFCFSLLLIFCPCAHSIPSRHLALKFGGLIRRAIANFHLSPTYSLGPYHFIDRCCPTKHLSGHSGPR
jgi:hypothetical protein